MKATPAIDKAVNHAVASSVVLIDAIRGYGVANAKADYKQHGDFANLLINTDEYQQFEADLMRLFEAANGVKLSDEDAGR